PHCSRLGGTIQLPAHKSADATRASRKCIRAYEQVYGPLPPIMLPISERMRERILDGLSDGTIFLQTEATAASLESADGLNGAGSPEPDGPQPDGGSGGGETFTAGMGFYRVVRTGVWIYGITNDTWMSGIVPIPIEAGYDYGTLE